MPHRRPVPANFPDKFKLPKFKFAPPIVLTPPNLNPLISPPIPEPAIAPDAENLFPLYEKFPRALILPTAPKLVDA
jgi:hypothetical protein